MEPLAGAFLCMRGVPSLTQNNYPRRSVGERGGLPHLLGSLRRQFSLRKPGATGTDCQLDQLQGLLLKLEPGPRHWMQQPSEPYFKRLRAPRQKAQKAQKAQWPKSFKSSKMVRSLGERDLLGRNCQPCFFNPHRCGLIYKLC